MIGLKLDSTCWNCGTIIESMDCPRCRAEQSPSGYAKRAVALDAFLRPRYCRHGHNTITSPCIVCVAIEQEKANRRAKA